MRFLRKWHKKVRSALRGGETVEAASFSPLFAEKRRGLDVPHGADGGSAKQRFFAVMSSFYGGDVSA
jgi:hypothetical protein